MAPALVGCVMGSASRPSRADTQTELAPPATKHGAAELLQPERGQVSSAAPDAAPPEGGIRVGGYWHWDGVRHVWIPDKWEAARPGYTRDWADGRSDSGT